MRDPTASEPRHHSNAAPAASSSQVAPSPASQPTHELAFASALQAADAIRKKKISSLELTRLSFDRIERYNPKLNAFAYHLKENALAQAAAADQAQAQGNSLGVFHGVPFDVKESFAIAGHPCSWGLPHLAATKSPRNSEVVDRLLGAGAVLTGATNVALNLNDWQSYNPVYGTTNNPWDLDRTPGGSSGGSAAAVAAGLSYLTVGSDLAGSIRVPAHFCGIYGHRPTVDLVNQRGHTPGGSFNAPGFTTLMGVAGPMARSAPDLLAALKIIGGPAGWDAKAWNWELPAPRANRLKDFRIGYVLDDPSAPPTSEVREVLEKTIGALSRSGARLKPGWPEGFQPSALLGTYQYLMYALLFSLTPPDLQEAQRKKLENSSGLEATASRASFAEWQRQNIRRLAFRAQWQAYFEHIDVFLCPVAFTAAFPHDHSDPQGRRSIPTPDGPRKYMELFNWVPVSSLTGCPATSAPIGQTAAGLPVGIQIIGPFWEDATTIVFADFLTREIGGFVPPPGFIE